MGIYFIFKTSQNDLYKDTRSLFACYIVVFYFFIGQQTIEAESYLRIDTTNTFNISAEHKNNIFQNTFIDKSITRNVPELMDQIKEHPNYEETTFHVFSHGRSGELFINGQWLKKEGIAYFLKEAIDIEKIKYLNNYA